MGRKPKPSRRKPSFFNVMIGDFTEHLKIPTAFVNKHFNGVLPQKLILRNPARRIWRVNVNRVENSSFFEKGWSSFVQDNSLELGDFLVFWYAGNSEFNVKFFGKSGCEKEVTVASRKSNPSSNEVICFNSDSSSDDETDKSSPNYQFRSIKFQPVQDSFKQLTHEERTSSLVGRVTRKSSCSIIVPMVLQGKPRALDAASKFVSKHPFFQVVMTQYYLRRAYVVNVRGIFFKGYIKEGQKSVVTLRVSNRSWLVELFRYGKSRARLGGSGMRAFVEDNSLQEGDVCVFEVIKRNDIVLNVSIFRCSA